MTRRTAPLPTCTLSSGSMLTSSASSSPVICSAYTTATPAEVPTTRCGEPSKVGLVMERACPCGSATPASGCPSLLSPYSATASLPQVPTAARHPPPGSATRASADTCWAYSSRWEANTCPDSSSSRRACSAVPAATSMWPLCAVTCVMRPLGAGHEACSSRGRPERPSTRTSRGVTWISQPPGMPVISSVLLSASRPGSSHRERKPSCMAIRRVHSCGASKDSTSSAWCASPHSRTDAKMAGPGNAPPLASASRPTPRLANATRPVGAQPPHSARCCSPLPAGSS
mmetsp:Transcript_10629/g.27020  ORF Transcript_10629/g.27020 Transcript_10629/m.27020 type:complete len:286 (-) Transcript_10629:1132-1989(-)